MDLPYLLQKFRICEVHLIGLAVEGPNDLPSGRADLEL